MVDGNINAVFGAFCWPHLRNRRGWGSLLPIRKAAAFIQLNAQVLIPCRAERLVQRLLDWHATARLGQFQRVQMPMVTALWLSKGRSGAA